MKATAKIYFFFILFFAALNCISQPDSLIYYFNHPSEQNLESGNRLLKSLASGDSLEFKKVASKLPKKEDKVAFYNALGERFYDEDDYETSRFYYTKALEFARLTLNKSLIAAQLQAVGDLYRLQDQNTAALNFLLQSMYMYKELNNDQKNLAHTLALIGDLNRCIDQYQDALKYLNESLEISSKINNIKDQTFCYSSLGGTYQALKEYEKAFAAYSKGLGISQKINDTMRIIDFNYSMGDLMIDRNRIPEAITYLEEGVRLSSVDDKYNLAFCRMGLSRAYLKKKNYDRSLEEGLKAYKIGEELKAVGFCTESSEVIYEAYAGKKDFANAFKYLKIVKDNNDSTMSSAKIKQQAQIEINFKNSFQEKQDSLVRFAEEQQKDMMHEGELKQQKILAVTGIGGLLVAMIVAFVVYRSYKKERRSRMIINKQKTMVDAKNKEIVDSINYAKKIQQAIIPTNTEVKNIFPESFIVLLPKDIVSGDFYWITEKENFVFLAVADCTGHGVPGGFMSMLGTALLNEIINDKNIYEPADILDMLKLKIILALKQSDNTNENKDGMDIALIRIDKSKNELTFSGANNSLYIIRNNKLTEYKGDKHPIGYSFNNTNKQFNQVKINLQKGDALYMITDGYPDQFGGPLGKKFKYKQLEQMLLQIHNEEMNEQRKKLLALHHEWKGNLEQVDDICVGGIRI